MQRKRNLCFLGSVFFIILYIKILKQKARSLTQQRLPYVIIIRSAVILFFISPPFIRRVACEYCLRALETAEENARRLSGIPALSLPHQELCRVRPELHQACPHCQVSGSSSRGFGSEWKHHGYRAQIGGRQEMCCV